ncbi:MAG: 1,4-dihydroxy-2-naphthoate octaprenyltransferase [Cardiobacteriaceae bacterium]|nr:1,4-dihydroxy-2-naphthoate octaprenyltransferase [Cardiobacteriaceae bacterium]
MRLIFELSRPRTLPLALAVICCGNALAYAQGLWRLSVFLLSILTALSLQILSNMANDYGDGIRGTDRNRPAHAPRRLTADGIIPAASMRKLLIAATIVSLSFGIALLAISIRNWSELFVFLILGILAILAAITYTVGRYAYGYYALGEVSVFCFFGLLGVIGSYYLQSGYYNASILLPATGCGLLSAAVLHVNNLRDIDNDKAAGKHTIAVKLGFARGKRLHLVLLISASLCYLAYASIVPYSALWLLLTPKLIAHGKRLYQADTPAIAGKELSSIVLCTCMLNLLFSLGLCLHV